MAFASVLERPSAGIAGLGRPTPIRVSVGTRLRLGLGLLVLLLVATWQLAAAFAYPTEGDGALRLSGSDSFVLAGLMPGDAIAPVVLTLRADGPVRYRVHVTWTGSLALASQAVLTLDVTGPGPGSFRGALADAHLGGLAPGSALDLRLDAGQTATLTIAGQVPLSAGNDLQGAELSARVVVDSNSPLD